MPSSRETDVLLLTRQDALAGSLRKNLESWDRRLDRVTSCAEASQHLLNSQPPEGTDSPPTLIVDGRHLEIDPIHLPDLILRETALREVRLICILDEILTERSEELLEAGYSALLSDPQDKSQLFTALCKEPEHLSTSAKVVSLNRYRQQNGTKSRKRILLADQHTNDLKRLAALMQKAGHRVTTAGNGEQALDALERQHFDITIINLHLPIMSGTQVIKLHRFTTPHPQWSCFIVITDQTTPATLRLCRDLQVRACLFKPVPVDALLELIDAAPSIAPDIPATPVRPFLPTQDGEEVSKTRFLHADMLDTQVLQTLEQLDNDSDFLPDLIAIFKRDSIAMLQGMQDAAETGETERFIELSSILMDNAGQLGAFALFEMCLTLQQISQRELASRLPAKLSRLRELVESTNRAFTIYLSKRAQHHTDQN